MIETYDRAGELLERKVVEAGSVPERMRAMLERDEVKELRARKLEVGDTLAIEGRTIRLTEAGFRRVDRYDPSKTYELTPIERALIGLIKAPK